MNNPSILNPTDHLRGSIIQKQRAWLVPLSNPWLKRGQESDQSGRPFGKDTSKGLLIGPIEAGQA